MIHPDKSTRNVLHMPVISLLIVFMLLAWTLSWSQTQKVVQQFSVKAKQIPRALLQTPKPTPWQGSESGPVANLQVFARESSGAVWLGSDQGAARFDPSVGDPWDRWHYFYGKRWLPDNEIVNIYIAQETPERQVWIRTKTGVSLISWRPMTLAEKAAYFETVTEARHVRHGFVSDSYLKKPGDLTSNVTTDSDNDGLWTAMYMAAQAYRFAVTGSEDARAKARRALNALIRLEEITGIPGFFARSFKSMDEPAPRGGEWHPTPDGKWLWKGDTSSDESVGHYYGYAIYYDLVADEAEKAKIRQVVARLTDHMIEHDYNLVDVDGKPTRWGEWGTAFYKTDEGDYEKALRSLELLSFLKVAYHITGDEKYQQAYWDRIDHGYATYTLYYRRWISKEQEINFSDDELYYLSVLPLMLYETDPALRDNYLAGLRFTWSQVRPDRNPLWNFMSVVCGADTMTADVLQESRKTLERIPLDLLNWGVKNSHRIDITMVEDADRHGSRVMSRVVAPDERRMHKHNGNPYVADDSGNGASEEAPTFFLLPYWMGRYYGFLE